MAAQQPSGARSDPREQESTASLLSRLVDDATALMRNEVALAKAEFAESIASVKTGIAALARRLDRGRRTGHRRIRAHAGRAQETESRGAPPRAHARIAA